jgi:hypothetical protein
MWLVCKCLYGIFPGGDIMGLDTPVLQILQNATLMDVIKALIKVTIATALVAAFLIMLAYVIWDR